MSNLQLFWPNRLACPFLFSVYSQIEYAMNSLIARSATGARKSPRCVGNKVAKMFSPVFERRRPLWMVSLVFLSAIFSLGFSCASPLAAFSAIGALTLRRSDALVVIGAVWLANQIVGFALLHYPLERAAFAWGAVLGATALVAMLAAQWVNARLAQRNRIPGSSAAFLAAFVTYEGVLWAISGMTANGLSNFAPAIVLRIFLINAAVFAALLFLRAVASGGLAKEGARPPLRAN
jgi:hypothetical protein